tara:strand:+ start:7203 stop:7790 length:588 start_codon:yes stop_codon:yes gene_type:complete
MALSYPLSTPTGIGIAQIELRASNTTATSASPFSYKQQVISFGGQQWSASVSIPSVRRDLAAPWKAMLIGLKGQVGSFLLGDPDYVTPQGTASVGTITGSVGAETVNCTLTGTLLAGDYIQLGASATSKLHVVLQDQDGDGTLDIWPALRQNYTSASMVLSSPKGVFRLTESMTSWSIDNASAYGISFEAVEVIV